MKKILEYFVDVFFFIYTTVVMILLFAIFGFLFSTYRGTYKKSKNQLIKSSPYFIAVLFFAVLFIAGYVHKDSNACELINVQSMVIQPLLYYSGLMISSVILYLKTK